jgi:hypothetical protein
MAGVGYAPCRPMIAEDVRDLQRGTRQQRRGLRGRLDRRDEVLEWAGDLADRTDGDAGVSVYSSRLTGRNRRLPTRSTNPSGTKALRPKRQGQPATGCSSTFACLGLRASFVLITKHQSGSWNGSVQFARHIRLADSTNEHWVHYRPGETVKSAPCVCRRCREPSRQCYWRASADNRQGLGRRRPPHSQQPKCR